MNFNELVAQLDPNYIRKMNHFRESMYAQAEIERFKANEAMNREGFKANADMQREQFRANHEDQRQSKQFNHDERMHDKKTSAEMQREQFKANADMNREEFRAGKEDARLERQIHHQKEMEKERNQGALSVEETRGKNNIELANFDRQTMLEKMELELRNSIFKSGFDSGTLTVQKMIDEDTARRASLTKQFEERSQLRGEVFKMLAGAIIQEKLAQKAHQRELEKMQTQSILQRTERYLESLCAYLLQVNKEQGERATKSEIDRVIGEWEAMG